MRPFSTILVGSGSSGLHCKEQCHHKAAWTEGPEEVYFLCVGWGTADDFSYNSSADE